MGIENKDKTTPTKKVLRLGTIQLARAALCKFITQRYNNAIDTATFKDMVNGLSNLLAYDKQMADTERDKRLDILEQYIKGEGGTIVDRSHIENPYAADLKKQLEKERKVNADLQNDILTMKRQLADLSTDSKGETD